MDNLIPSAKSGKLNHWNRSQNFRNFESKLKDSEGGKKKCTRVDDFFQH